VRILAISDVHGHMGVYRWMSQLLDDHRIDVVVLAGDLLHGAGDDLSVEEAQRREGDELIEILRGIDRPVLYVMGNDDMIDLGYEDERIHPIHGRAIGVEGRRFVGYQYTVPFMGGIFEKVEEEIETDLLGLEPVVNEETVLVTYSPAHGVLDRTAGGSNAGSESLRDFIGRRRVKAHIHGHIHKCSGREGNHFNVASGRAFRAIWIDLDGPRGLEHGVIALGPSARTS
jgi:Icc-related predicted phosphoesterase